MSTNVATANKSEAGAKPAETKKPRTMLVLDATAIPGGGPREHQQLVGGVLTTFTFQPGKPLELAYEIAVKFLRHGPAAFRLVDAEGKVLEYKTRPRQPEELGAGEHLVLAPEETVARYDELSNTALMARALELPMGEAFAKAQDKLDRGKLIAFIRDAKLAIKKANTVNEADKDAFVPEVDDDELAA